MRAFAAFYVGLLAFLVAAPAFAVAGGLAGYTGKPNATAPQGESCNQCHTGGAAPQVTINGPASLAAGQVGDYSLVVQTGLSRAAGGIATTDGAVLTAVSGLRETFGELVQDVPLTVSGGQATFRFRVTAPLAGTSLRLWAVGLAANGSGNTGGDRATQTMRQITVTGGAPTSPPDAGATSSSSSSGSPPPGSGEDDDDGGNGGNAGSSGSSGSAGTAGTAGGTDDDDADGRPASSNARPGPRVEPAGEVSCAVGRIGMRNGSPQSNGALSCAVGSLTTALLAVVLRMRRRRGEGA